MRLFATLSLILSAAALSACSMQGGAADADGSPMVSPILTTDDAKDVYSYAQPEVARVTHVALDLALDFEDKNVEGTATLDVLAADGADTVVLDTMGLEIASIADNEGNDLPFELAEVEDGMGAALTVTIGDKRQIVIAYKSGPDARALQWLVPEQTAGGEHPYLLSQGQPTLNRTWIPTQDSPGIRQTWEAKITAPEPLTVVMSGLSGGDPVAAGEGRRAFTFIMDKPVAPYLIAIAAGDIVFQELGPGSGVWTQPVMREKAPAELVQPDQTLHAAAGPFCAHRGGLR